MNLRWTGLGWGVSLLLATGCGDDGAAGGTTADDGATTVADDDGASMTSTASTASTAATTSTDDDGSSGATTSSGSDSLGSSGDDGARSSDGDDTTGGEGVACGDALSCSAPDVCVQEFFEPPCQPHDPRGGMCPAGQTEQLCGGAGFPCCCGEAPAPEYSCVTASECPAAPTCDCVPCPGGKGCTAEDDGTFRCEPLPVP